VLRVREVDKVGGMTDAVDTATTAAVPQRVKMLNAIYAVYERRAQVAYSQQRPSQLLNHLLPVRTAAKRITRADCSGLAALGCDWAGIRKDVDWRYTNTWSQLALFPHETSLAHAEPGDLVFYGPRSNDPTHVAVYKGGGQVYSNGSHPMSIQPIDYRGDRIHIRSVLLPFHRL
jgi:cell wall-associated NlpC family hydrolase